MEPVNCKPENATDAASFKIRGTLEGNPHHEYATTYLSGGSLPSLFSAPVLEVHSILTKENHGHPNSGISVVHQGPLEVISVEHHGDSASPLHEQSHVGEMEDYKDLRSERSVAWMPHFGFSSSTGHPIGDSGHDSYPMMQFFHHQGPLLPSLATSHGSGPHIATSPLPLGTSQGATSQGSVAPQAWMRGDKSLIPSELRFPLSEAPGELIRRLTARQAHTAIRAHTRAALLDNYNENDNRFMLLEQPNEIQRKSYGKENRCILPNPLVICQKKALSSEPERILDGTVSVKLVDEDGYELSAQRQKLLESVIGGMTHTLDDGNSSSFSIKILHTSEGHLFRLLFTVNYRTFTDPRPIEEKIITRPFVVYSKKHSKAAPIKKFVSPVKKSGIK
eukprot:TRINITY_DN2409_c0_g1_i1.p1 TRINITY_DN2409_c0_g1~~TRINITY_DN2409_c0_g1_i1.p1  ORF type:complete len:401 (+),score=87.19 TRINITY_DN2409_c0_g1_i1:28-1203(+)